MNTLHILNKPPEHPRFRHCLASIGLDDTLLLTENGVLATIDNDIRLPPRTFSLSADMEARGIPAATTTVQTIDHTGMVNLTTEHTQIISW